MTMMGGSSLGRKSRNHRSTRGRGMRTMGGRAGTHATKDIIDTDGIILMMGGKGKVKETT